MRNPRDFVKPLAVGAPDPLTEIPVTPSRSKLDRGVVKVKTDAYKQDGTLVATFKRAVLVPRRNPGE